VAGGDRGLPFSLPRGEAGAAGLDRPRPLRVEPLSAGDVSRLDELLARYERMDLADATLVLLAEKTGVMEIFTIDRRDFEIYRTRKGRRFRLLLT
jgi:hypothetical protein